MNRSVDGDVVAVELLPKSEWKAAGSQVIDQEGQSCYSERHSIAERQLLYGTMMPKTSRVRELRTRRSKNCRVTRKL